MHTAAQSIRGPRLVAASALLMLVPAWLAAPLFEFPRGERYADTDDPAGSLAYLNESGALVVLSGISLLVATAALVAAAAAFEVLFERSTPGGRSSGVRAIAVTAYLGAGLLALAGSLRVSMPGTLSHIEGLNLEWGRTGYLVMHLVGTQGALAGARLVLAVWMLGVMVLAVRRRILPRWTLAMLPIPAILLLTIVGPLVSMATSDESVLGEVGWVLVMLVFFLGVPLWCGVVAACLFTTARRRGRAISPPDRAAARAGTE